MFSECDKINVVAIKKNIPDGRIGDEAPRIKDFVIVLIAVIILIVSFRIAYFFFHF